MARGAEKISKVALYARVSTTEQEGTSIDTQIERMEKYCLERELEIYDKYKDNGYSGSNLNRPAYQRLILDADHGKFDRVLVYQTDRIARNIVDSVVVVLRELIGKGVAFTSITEPYDTSTPAGKAFFVDMAKYADLEREMIRERTMRGRLKKASEGKWVGACPHYAYDINKAQELVVNKKRAEIVITIIEWFLSGMALSAIATKLNEMEVPTWRQIRNWGGNKKKFDWSPGTLRHMITNPVITGKSKFMGQLIKCSPIIDEKTFNSIKQRLKTNKDLAKRNAKHFYLLRGLLFCKRCDHKLYAFRRTVQRVKSKYIESAYFCPSIGKIKGMKSCGLHSVKPLAIENCIWEKAKELVTNSEKLKSAIHARYIDLFTNKIIREEEIKEYESSIKRYQAEKSKLLSLYTSSGIYTVKELDEKAQEIQFKIEETTKKRERLIDLKNQLLEKQKHLDNTQNFFNSISKRLIDFTEEEKRQLIMLLFKKICVDWDEVNKVHLIEIEGSIPIIGSDEEPTQTLPQIIGKHTRILATRAIRETA